MYRKIARLSLAVLLLFPVACAHHPMGGIHPKKGLEPVQAGTDFLLWQPCTPEQAQQWATVSKTDPPLALRAASCYAVLAQNEGNSLHLAYARSGRELASSFAEKFKENGLAHYLNAYLTALEAEKNPLGGLELVPIIEREARLAADLTPRLDRGGADRLLGELYLRAPGFPISVGDSSEAVRHYRRAVAFAPEFLENRLGLAEALLAEEDLGGACKELKEILAKMPPVAGWENEWRKSLEMLQGLCNSLPAP